VFVSGKVLAILAIYLLTNIAYSLDQHIVILDGLYIASDSCAHLWDCRRGIAPSQWLLLCGLMMALFLGFAKRRAELYALTGDGPSHRKVLTFINRTLDNMIVVTGPVILTYSLYTMSPATIQFTALSL